MSPFIILALFIAIFMFFAIVLRMPIPVCMGISGMVCLVLTKLNVFQFTEVVFSNLDSFAMLAMPYFLFAGALMLHSGISDSILNMIDSFVGRIRGRLGMITFIASAAFGTLTGATMATLSAIGGMMIGPMKKQGYTKEYIAAVIASASFLGVLIPPSVPGIIFATSAGLMVSDVWLSCLLPGLLLTVLYCITNYFVVGRHEPKATETITFSEFTKNAAISTKNAFWALLMPIFIFGGIYGGIVTPTEAGAVSAVYGVIYYVVKRYALKREVSSNLFQIAVSAAGTSGVIGLCMALSGASGRVIALSGIADKLANFIADNVHDATVFLLLSMLLFYFLGMIIDHTSSTLIMTPLLMPSVYALGIDPYHFGALLVVTLAVGQITPPFAASLYLSMKMVGCDIAGEIKALLPFLVCCIIVTTAIVFCPWLSLALIG